MSIVASLQMQSEIAQLPLDDLAAMVARLEWLEGGRPDQMPPPEGDDNWFFWLLMAGRGAGKTRAGAEDVWWYAFTHPGARVAVVAPTSQDCRKTCFEGESGLIARIPHWLVASWNRGELLLTMKNGSQFQGFSAEEPDRLRGPQHHRAWCDELAAWRYLDETLDNLLMGLRLGDMPRIVATTTPRPIKRLKEIVADDTTVVDTVSTYANMENLPRIFVEKILKRYEGSRLGRQELYAEILTDNPGALWQRETIDDLRQTIPDGRFRGVVLVRDPKNPDVYRIVTLQRIVVAVDPSITSKQGSDETGIVVGGLGDDGRGYVLADESMQGTPAEWGEAAVTAYDKWGADRIVYESNQGGEMVALTLVSSARAMRDAGKRKTDFVPVTDVWASRGKVTRAEPVSALYEQGRVSHVGTHAALEDQMCEFTSDFDKKVMGYSPDRVDALVWLFTELMLDQDSGLNVQDFYRQEANAHADAIAARKGGLSSGPTGDLVALLPPAGVTSATGAMGNMYTVDTTTGLMMVHAGDVPPLRSAGFILHDPEQEAA